MAGLTTLCLTAVGCGDSSEAAPGLPGKAADRAFVLVPPPAGQDWTDAQVVSPDGLVVAGSSGVHGPSARAVFHWSAAGGPQGTTIWTVPPHVITDPSTELEPYPFISMLLSADSSTVAGTVAYKDTVSLFAWDQVSDMSDLGPIPGAGVVAIDSIDISAGGQAVMATADRQAFRWTRAEGRMSLGQVPGDLGNAAVAMSPDGTVIVGNSMVTEKVSRLFRWTAASGITALDVPLEGDGQSGNLSCETRGPLSDDGLVVYGLCHPATPEQQPLTLFRWSATEGARQIALPVPFAYVQPFRTTADGAVLVGVLEPGAPPLPGTPPATQFALFRWRLDGANDPSGGWELLPPPPGELDCVQHIGTNGDATVVVGRCGQVIVRWDGAGAATVLDPPAGFEESIANSVSADGHVIAGAGRHPWASGDKNTVAVVWDDRRGGPRSVSGLVPSLSPSLATILVTTLLTEQGLDTGLGGARLRRASVSQDGRTLIGDALDNQYREVGWVARFPP